MIKNSNLIQRRELEPLLLKAHKIVKHYEKAADCAVSVLGPDCDSVNSKFCSLCGRCRRSLASTIGKKACVAIHRDAINEARRLGGSYVYVCPAGFVFWTSPFYSGERFAGALLSGGILGVEKKQAVENIMQNCGAGMCREEVECFLTGIPEKNRSEVKALAQMMLMCADQISGIGFSSKTITSGLDITMTMESGQRAKIAPFTAQPKAASRRKGKNPDISGDDYPMDKERMLLASLRRGDNGEARKILKELLDILYKTAQGNFPAFRLKSMELAVMLSRAVCNPQDIEDDSILETNNRYLKKIEEGRSLKEITEILTVIVERMSGKIFSFQGVRHSAALRKAERYIWENYTRKISLQEIAGASGLSAPYFSTIFKEEMGENLSNYLNRLRVEKAASMLAETDMHISGIAASCGFEDQSWFSKIFKSYTGFSPGKFREKGGLLN